VVAALLGGVCLLSGVEASSALSWQHGGHELLQRRAANREGVFNLSLRGGLPGAGNYNVNGRCTFSRLGVSYEVERFEAEGGNEYSLDVAVFHTRAGTYGAGEALFEFGVEPEGENWIVGGNRAEPKAAGKVTLRKHGREARFAFSLDYSNSHRRDVTGIVHCY
jgi:hypothetical protein